jgi:hypothetical protein
MAKDNQQLTLPGFELEEPVISHKVQVRGKDVDVTERNYLDMYWKFIYTRHLIWYKRFVLGQPPPWTEDPTLREYKFTNMYRELDRGTLYLLDNIIGPLETHGPAKAQIFNTIMYRVFNRIETWEAVKDLTHIYGDSATVSLPWDRYVAFDRWRKMGESGRPIYTDAHMVCAYNGTPGHDKLARIEYIFQQMHDKIDDLYDLVMGSKSLKDIWTFLKNMNGLGPFLAYEIAVDISYAPWNHHHEDEWVNAGPGCQIGINIIFPNTPPKQCPDKIFYLRDIQQEEFARLSLPWETIAYKGRWLTLRNIEHCCCEFQKYVKAVNATGRPRNRFRATAQLGVGDFNRLKG